MKRILRNVAMLTGLLIGLMACGTTASNAGGSYTALKPANGELRISLSGISDGKAHYYKVPSDDGTTVYFFVMKSHDGIFRAAIDSCDVCYKAGKGYYQDGDFMVCENCGQRFASTKINEIKGGCNPAPLNRKVDGDQIVISMKDINANTWYMQYRVKT